jgi:hypothetical protein
LIISAQRSGLRGEVHVFSPNGNLLSTIVPTGVFSGIESGRMGNAVTALGNNRVIADWVNTQAAYLYELIPSVSVQRTPTNSLAVSWSSFAPDFALQQNTNGLATGNWSNVTETIQDDGTNKYIIFEPTTDNRYYRLIKP